MRTQRLREGMHLSQGRVNEGGSSKKFSQFPISESVLQLGPYIHLRVPISGSTSLRGLKTKMHISINRHRVIQAAA